VSKEIKTHEFDNVLNLLVESSKKKPKHIGCLINGIPFETYMENPNEVLEHVELQLQIYLEDGR
jgi:hypothetical protein